MYQSTSTQLSKHSLNHSNVLGLLDIETFSGSVIEVYKDDSSQLTVTISPRIIRSVQATWWAG
jgi:hypothetical protein